MCDTFVALAGVTKHGSTIFGKNSDRHHEEAQHLQYVPARHYEPGGGVRLTYVEVPQVRRTNAVILSKPWWLWGAEIGANEHGLVIGNEAIFARTPASLEPGIIGMDYLRLALERAWDVDEAIDVITGLLKEHGQSGNCGSGSQLAYDNSYLLCDARSAKVLETVDRDWVVRGVDDYEAISNALIIDTDFDAASDEWRSKTVPDSFGTEEDLIGFKRTFDDPGRSASGAYRRDRAVSMLRSSAPGLEPAHFFNILRDHQEGESIDNRPPPRICMHQRSDPVGSTTASWVSDIADALTIHWVTATAAPCTSVFKPVVLGLGIFDHGPLPSGEPDGLSLWWRHEVLRRWLEDADLNREFAEERDALEKIFLARFEGGSSRHWQADLERNIDQCWRDAIEFEDRWHGRRLATGASAPAVGGSVTNPETLN